MNLILLILLIISVFLLVTKSVYFEVVVGFFSSLRNENKIPMKCF